MVLTVAPHRERMESALTSFGTTLRRAGSETVKRTAMQMRNDLRQDVVRGGLGQRLSRSWKFRAWPDRAGKTPTSLVFSRAPEIIRGHSQGGIIRSRTGKWLAIPTDAVPRGRGGGALSPTQLERRFGLELRLIARPGRPGLLVADNAQLTSRGRLRTLTRRRRHGAQFTALSTRSRRAGVQGRATVVLFTLLPMVRLPKRLNTERLIRKNIEQMNRLLDETIVRLRPK